MNYIVRHLDPLRDENKLIDLFESNATVLIDHRSPSQLDEMTAIIPTLLTDPLYFTMVIEMNNELIGVFVGKEFEFQPAWTWGYWMHRPGKINEIWVNDGFDVLKQGGEMVFKEMEDRRKLTRFYWVFPDKKDEMGIRTAGSGERWLSSNVGVRYMARGQNYSYFDDCYIPAGTMPKYPYQQAIAGNRTWDFDIRIRMGVLNDSVKGK